MMCFNNGRIVEVIFRFYDKNNFYLGELWVCFFYFESYCELLNRRIRGYNFFLNGFVIREESNFKLLWIFEDFRMVIFRGILKLKRGILWIYF